MQPEKPTVGLLLIALAATLLMSSGMSATAAAVAGQNAPSAVEASLSLDRPTRRVIQQGLRNEGFDPGAPDGLFGPRTRGAIRDWQQAQGAMSTGYLTGAEVELLRRAAAPPLEGALPSALPPQRAQTDATEATGNAQLPPEIMADRHLVRAERLLAAEEPEAALEVMNEVLALEREHGLALANDFRFRYAQMAFAAGRTETAIASLNEYLIAAGTAGEFYREALELLSALPTQRAQTGATEATGNAQLPPEIMADRHLVRAERLLAAEEPEAALEVMNEVLALEREHGLALANDFRFRYAQMAFAAGRTETAIASLNEYLIAAGTAGEFYREALELLDSGELRLSREIAERERLARWPPGSVFRECEVCPEMVVLPGAGVALGRFEVTVGEYRAFASATGAGARFGPGAGYYCADGWQDPYFPQTDRHPVTCLNWDEAQQYVSWLSRQTGARYRLPTGAEWEAGVADSRPVCYARSERRGTCPVDSYRANSTGLFGMLGNVREWMADCGDDCGERMVRPYGTWSSDDASGLHVRTRFVTRHPQSRWAIHGFRVARTLLDGMSSLTQVNVAAPGSAAEDDHGDIGSAATEVELGSYVRGRLEGQDDVDVFRFNIRRAGTLTAETSGHADTLGRLTGDCSNESEVIDDDGGEMFNFRIRRRVSPGVCFVQVDSFRGEGQIDRYTLYVSLDPGLRRRRGDVFRDCDECPEMVVLADGDLAMGRYEVTVGEYRAFVSATGGRTVPYAGGIGADAWLDPRVSQTDRHPVDSVSWDEAQEYVQWLSLRTGATYRLPSEAEWVRAASGSDLGCHYSRTGHPSRTCPVGSYGSNQAGLSDMFGNVSEWTSTSDCPEHCNRRVIRGGEHGRFIPPEVRHLPRESVGPDFHSAGFRVARRLGS
ncbi:MAG: SUMF1/EgtB/PvdO family nonheme iron enzyme [Acidobacteria bacterium]|nr:SUMF1/EgtB/PvdO family nonheme iron enzyme [Acidobacteriota bacterium]